MQQSLWMFSVAALMACSPVIAGCSQDAAGEPLPPRAESAAVVAVTAVPTMPSAAAVPPGPSAGGVRSLTVAVPSPRAVVPLASPARCVPGTDLSLFVAPRAPRAGRPLRVLAHGDKALAGALVLRDPAGAVVQVSDERHGGPPYFWAAEIPSAARGTYRAVVQQRSAAGDRDEITACLDIAVEDDPPVDSTRLWGVVWGNQRAWDRGMENLYSAWIERLFDAPLGEQLSFGALHEVLRDPKRNLLHDYLGTGEDDGGRGAAPIDPDCADLPYFLRAYFSFKLGLPFGFSSCTRGGGGLGPTCLDFRSNLYPAPQRKNAFDTFTDFLRGKLADTVHSGTGRAPADKDGGDYYPVPLDLKSLRPGAIYADPYGHILVVVKRIPQTETAGGILLAVDGQPDATVSRKRFWRGSFLFALGPEMGSPGFKRFRPVRQDARGVRGLTNKEILADPDYGDYALDQYSLDIDGFYDRMDDVLSPSPLDPARAMLETIAALEEQVKTRVVSVKNAEKFFVTAGRRVEMPKGPTIFETTGPWEDFSTPSRDMRLLIAIDVVSGFPARVARRPERYAIAPGKDIAALRGELDALLAKELSSRTIQYERSDGSPFTLSLADVVSRAPSYEMAYNPNDCAEVRWGAPPGSDEASTCRRHTGPSQLAAMGRYRRWFHERKRPARK
ncbi:MAG: hypothetical protein U0359_34335 [Byssovorax sp.]